MHSTVVILNLKLTKIKKMTFTILKVLTWLQHVKN